MHVAAAPAPGQPSQTTHSRVGCGAVCRPWHIRPRQVPDMFVSDWDRIGLESQEHLKQLGWRKMNWTSGADVSSDGVGWDKLGRNERESAKALGFTGTTWKVLNDFARGL